jgi:glucan phosphoethanolaminetransferase (alkaline phosphatase superfamily)
MFMFGFAAICWAIWTARNRVCFEKVQIKHPYELIFFASLLIQYWTGLYAMVDQAMIQNGVTTMMKTTMELLKKSQRTQAPRRIT